MAGSVGATGDFASVLDGTTALVRHRAHDRISLNVDRGLRAVIGDEMAKDPEKPEAAVIRDLVIEGLKARGHQIETRRRGRLDTVHRVMPAPAIT
jgi:hypothetical protein